MNDLLKNSRIFVCWGAVGLMIGVYDNTIKHLNGKNISSKNIILKRISINSIKNCKNDV